jgi:hypothetical protein
LDGLLDGFEGPSGTLIEWDRGDRGSRGVDQAAASQQRSEIIDLAVMVEDFVVDLGEEFAEADAFPGGDFVKCIPKRHLQANGCRVTADSKRSGLRFIVALRLVREDLAHHIPPLIFFEAM